MEFHGGPAQHPLPRLDWRAMTAADLDAVAAVAAVGFPDHFEGRDCFENRLALNPAGCFVLAGEDGLGQGPSSRPGADGFKGCQGARMVAAHRGGAGCGLP